MKRHMDATFPLEITCKKCKKKHTRDVKVYEPESFSEKGTKSVMSQFWCPHYQCKEINAIRYTFVRGKNGEIHVKIKGWVDPVGVAFLRGDEEASKTKKK